MDDIQLKVIDGSFIDQAYIKMKAGEFIKIELNDDDYKNELVSLIARKVAD